MSWCVEPHGLSPERRTAGLFGVGLGPGVVGGRHVVCSTRHFENNNNRERAELRRAVAAEARAELRQCNVSDASVKVKTRGSRERRPNREHESLTVADSCGWPACRDVGWVRLWVSGPTEDFSFLTSSSVLLEASAQGDVTDQKFGSERNECRAEQSRETVGDRLCVS